MSAWTPLKDSEYANEIELDTAPLNALNTLDDASNDTEDDSADDSDGVSEDGLHAKSAREAEQTKRGHAVKEVLAELLSTSDDPNLPTLTFRFWTLSTLFTIIGGSVGQFYYFRSATLSLSIFFVQLLSHFMGRAMAEFIPRDKMVRIGTLAFSLNPGPWNAKEHCLITACSSTSLGVAYAIDILAVQRLYFDQDIGPVGSILLLWTTQCLGYGMAGLLRSWLVDPPAMYWPGTLPIVALFNTLHSQAHGTDRRLAFFAVVFVVIFTYEVLPSFIAPTLSSICIVCLLGGGLNGTIGRMTSFLGSGFAGAGIFSVSLDWNYVGIVGPLFTPLWAQLNYLIAALLFTWIVTPLLYSANLWDAQKFPMFGTSSYSMDGSPWNVSAVLNPDLTLNEAAFEQDPLRLSPYWALMYGISFLNLSAVLVHILLYHGREIYDKFTESRQPSTDIHAQMMQVYPEVPNSVYMALFGFMTLLSIFCVQAWPVLQLPWWGVIFAIAIAAIFVLPIGILQAVSNQQVGLNVLTEFIIGLILPGQPLANVMFKVYGYMALSQALSLTADLKLAQYMKIPPRAMLVAQMYGTVLSAIVNYIVMNLILANVNLLDNEDPAWTPRSSRIFYTASLIWGAVAPARLFGPLTPYRPLLWFFLVGALLPIPFWLLHRKYPRQKWHLVNIPIMALGAGAAGSQGSNWILSALVVSIFAQGFVKVRYADWFSSHMYLLSAALDSAAMFAAIGLFLAFGVHGILFPNWWLNPPNGNVEYCQVK